MWVVLCLCTQSFPVSALLCGTGSAYCGLCVLGSLEADFRLGSGTELCWQENFPCSSAGKESACNAGDPGSIPESGRSFGEGIGHPLQYSWTSLVVDLAACNAGDLGLIPGSGRSQLSGNCRQKRKKSGCFFSDPSLAGCLREQVCSSMTI